MVRLGCALMFNMYACPYCVAPYVVCEAIMCNCIVHVSHNFVFAIIVNCLYSCFFCFCALSTQQGGYVRATNLYYYYYYYYYYTQLECSNKVGVIMTFFSCFSIKPNLISLFTCFVQIISPLSMIS